MGQPGCVGYLFDRKGLILIDATKYPDEDKVISAALEAEPDDVQKGGDVYTVTTDPTKFNAVLDAITAAGIETIEAEIKQLPKAYTEVEVEIGKRIVRLMDTLDNNDDVQNVYTTANLTAAMQE
jgi:transcriptional/translational regulatory protein YebC/TACO1